MTTDPGYRPTKAAVIVGLLIPIAMYTCGYFNAYYNAHQLTMDKKTQRDWFASLSQNQTKLLDDQELGLALDVITARTALRACEWRERKLKGQKDKLNYDKAGLVLDLSKKQGMLDRALAPHLDEAALAEIYSMTARLNAAKSKQKEAQERLRKAQCKLDGYSDHGSCP